MEKVCPVCNEINRIDVQCKKCHGMMVDKGRTEEYIDPYGAEWPVDDRENYCMHFYKCQVCGCEESIKIEKVVV